MDAKHIMQIFEETAYIRMGGSPEELRAAQYLQDQVSKLGMEARIVPFEVPMSDMKHAALLAGGVEVPCKGYLCSGSADLEAPLYYLRNDDKFSLSLCRGKIVMIEGYMGYWKYQDLVENGAVGFITFSGDANYVDREIDQRELREFVHKGNRIPGVNINVKDAVSLIEQGVSTVRIQLQQEEYTGHSHNVILDMPGQMEEYITIH